MKRPIIIDSSVEFVIAGPLIGSDGIIIQSQDANIDLIGFAYKMYHIEEDTPVERDLSSKFNINYLWVDMPGSNNTSRKYKLLFCWKSVSLTGASFVKIDKSARKGGSIKFELDKFIENAYSVIKNYTSNPLGELDQSYEKYVAIIKWQISPVLLQCSFPEINF